MPNPLSRIGAYLKRTLRGSSPKPPANNGSKGMFSGAGGGGYGPIRILRPGAQYDWEKQADPLEGNSAVASCLRWINANFSEPDLIVTRNKGKGHRDPIENQPLVRLHENPNPAMDRFTFDGWKALALILNGNHYIYMQRSRAGRVIALWPLHFWLMGPVYPRDGSEWLTAWRYRVNGRLWDIPVEDVIHMTWGIPDRHNDRLHVSPLVSAVREVCTDNEALTISAGLCKNAGIPALAIVPMDSDNWLTAEQATDLKDLYREHFTADEAGSVFVPTGPIRLEKVAYSPAEMALDKLQRIPESRICSTIGIPAQVVNLLVGEQTGAGQFGTAREQARKAAYEDCLIPLQKRSASAYKKQLLPNLVPNPDAYDVLYDYSAVQCLSENEDAKHKRYRDDLLAGAIMRSEYRTAMSLPVTKDDEVYYLPKGAMVVTGDNFAVATNPEINTEGENTPEREGELENNPEADESQQAAVDRANAQNAPADKGGDSGGKKPAKPTKAVEDENSLPFDEEDLAAARELYEQAKADAGIEDASSDEAKRVVLNQLIDTAVAEFHADGLALVEALKPFMEEPEPVKGFLDGAKAVLSGWKKSVGKNLRRLFLAAALVVGGGEITEDDGLVVREAHAQQVEYLERFEEAIENGEQAVTDGIANRESQYAHSAWETGMAVIDDRKKKQGLGFARNVLGEVVTSHCEECPALTARGWVPASEVGTPKFPLPGGRQCIVLCRCHIEYGGVAGVPPVAPDASLAKVRPTRFQIEEALGAKFEPSFHAGEDKVVIVDLAKLRAALERDTDTHVGPGGTGVSAKPGAYERFGEFLAKAKENGTPIEMPRLGLDADGNPIVGDGRHRLAYFTDLGLRYLPVTVDPTQAKVFAKQYGAGRRTKALEEGDETWDA